MENNELLRRAEDLYSRCQRTGSVTNTGFLTPAERESVEAWARHMGADHVFFGGSGDCERQVCFFLPDYMDAESFDGGEYIRALCLKAYFGKPEHRDYMGALLGMGVGREWVGDIQVTGELAYIFCLPSVLPVLLGIEKAGRCTVKGEQIELGDVPVIQREVKCLSFSVQSPRLDAVVAGMFRLSRSEAARETEAGFVSLNHVVCLKTDAQVRPGDVISLRGRGKGKVTGTGGTSRKGRIFINAEIYL